ncbi:MAG: tRNA-dihydrouridine synthase, partial [Paracoccaceae bacterium]
MLNAHRLSVAPMMDWTDRHCRVFHRVMTRRAMLYTEMVTAQAVVHGD